MYEEKINAYFDAPERRAELVEAISRLVRIRSVREEPLPGMPFGPGPPISTTRRPPFTFSATWTWWARAPAGQ